jgi:hypothetical protein
VCHRFPWAKNFCPIQIDPLAHLFQRG